MIIKVNVEDFKKAVADLDLIMKGNQLPILNSLLITAENAAIKLTVNNLNIKVDKTLPGTVLADGKAVLSRDDLLLLLKMKDTVEMEIEGNQCTVKGTRVFKFDTFGAAEDFPVMPEVPEGEPDFAIYESELLHCLKLKVIAADAEVDKLRALWVNKNNILACDGYKLGKIEVQFETSCRFMLPDFVVAYLAKALNKKASSMVEFWLSDTKSYVKARSESFEITFRQYEGDFLSYEGMFDTAGAKTVVLKKNQMAEAIAFMCDIGKSGSAKKRKNPVVYTFGGNRLKLAYSVNGKQVNDEVAYTTPTPETDDIDLTIGFDPFYNYELLSMVESEQVVMSFKTPYSPSIIRGDKDSEKYLLLPVRLKDAEAA